MSKYIYIYICISTHLDLYTDREKEICSEQAQDAMRLKELALWRFVICIEGCILSVE